MKVIDGVKYYDVHDIKRAECSLEPTYCIHCGKTGEMVYDQGVGDGYCQICGRWQLEDEDRGCPECDGTLDEYGFCDNPLCEHAEDLSPEVQVARLNAKLKDNDFAVGDVICIGDAFLRVTAVDEKHGDAVLLWMFKEMPVMSGSVLGYCAHCRQTIFSDEKYVSDGSHILHTYCNDEIEDQEAQK